MRLVHAFDVVLHKVLAGGLASFIFVALLNRAARQPSSKEDESFELLFTAPDGVCTPRLPVFLARSLEEIGRGADEVSGEEERDLALIFADDNLKWKSGKAGAWKC